MPKQWVIINGKKRIYKRRVFSYYAASKDGEIVNVKTEKILKPRLTKTRYHRIIIYDKNLDKQRDYYIHRFVNECFYGLIPEGYEIDHIQPDKSNNQIKNLQLLTHKENVQK